jgi:hypothetical protein
MIVELVWLVLCVWLSVFVCVCVCVCLCLYVREAGGNQYSKRVRMMKPSCVWRLANDVTVSRQSRSICTRLLSERVVLGARRAAVGFLKIIAQRIYFKSTPILFLFCSLVPSRCFAAGATAAVLVYVLDGYELEYCT